MRLDLVHSVLELNRAARLKGRCIFEPIRITSNGTIIAGFRDWHLAVSNGKPQLDCIEYSLSEEEALEYILTQHRPRRGWNNFTRVRVALELEPHFQRRALANQIAGGKLKGSANLLKAEHIEVREEIATVAGVSGRTVANVKTILKKAAPALVDALQSTMVTAGGLQVSTGEWVPRIFWDEGQLTKLWRNAVIKLIRSAYWSGRLRTETTFEELEAMLTHWASRWWSVKVQSFKSREHFLRYAGRYVRRPPIAQRRTTRIEKKTITFWAKDKKWRRLVDVQYPVEEFIDSWIQHIPQRYQHCMRYFGLFAPRAISQTMATIFAAVGQMRRPRPKRRSWAASIKKDFGWDPLLDGHGKRMHWVGRLAPTTSS